MSRLLGRDTEVSKAYLRSTQLGQVAGMTGPRFLLVGAELSINRGTASIGLSAIEEIKRVFENPEITVLSYSSETDRHLETSLAVRIPQKEPKIKMVAETVLLVIERCLRVKLPCGECRKTEYQNSDVVIHLGGDGLNDDCGPFVSILGWLPFLWCLILGIPSVIHSQSIGPFNNRVARRVARFFLDRVDLLIVREEISRDYLTGIGVKREILLTADGAFLLNPVSEDAAREILRRERVPLDRGRQLVCVAPSELMFKRSFAKSGSETGRYLHSLVEVVDRMVEEHDVDVVFIPHVTDASMDLDDRGVAVDIANRSKHKDRMFVMEGEYRPEELRGIIGLCTLFIGSRMHASIAALSMHVPTVAISYSIKTPGIMSMAGLGHYVLHWNDPPERLLEMVEEAWNNRTETRQHLLQRIPEIQLMARRNAELISERVIRGEPCLSKNCNKGMQA